MTESNLHQPGRMESITILRDQDAMICQIWTLNAGRCGRVIRVPQAAAGSHRSMSSYLAAVEQHDAEYHARPTVPEPDDDLVPITLVPVSVFGGDCDCHIDAGHAYEQPEGTPKGMTAQEQPSGVIKLVPKCHGWGYGLCDAVQSWSDCNRADGRIYRVDDTDPQYRQSGETVTVWVPGSALPWFQRRFGEQFAHEEAP